MACDNGAILAQLAGHSPVSGSKPLILTHDGQAALEHGQRVLDAADAFADAVSPAASPSGVLRIGTAHALAEVVAERPLDLLRSKFPDLPLRVCVDWTKPLLDRLAAGDLDAAVISLLTDDPPKAELPAHRLGRDRVQIVDAADLGSAGRPLDSPPKLPLVRDPIMPKLSLPVSSHRGLAKPASRNFNAAGPRAICVGGLHPMTRCSAGFDHH